MSVPKIKSVEPLEDMVLLVIFDNGVKKKYDIKPLIFRFPVFKDLENRSLFRLARADCGGCGVVWNDDLDLSRYEIWANGVNV